MPRTVNAVYHALVRIQPFPPNLQCCPKAQVVCLAMTQGLQPPTDERTRLLIIGVRSGQPDKQMTNSFT